MAVVAEPEKEGSPCQAAPLEIRLFGPFSARVRGEVPPRLRTRKTEWLVGLLVLRHGRAVSRAWLAETLWPDAEPERGRFYLRREVSALRQSLGPESGRLLSPTTQTLQLAVDGAWIDLIEFDAAVARGDEASLERAVSLHRGDMLEGCLEDWLLPEREERRSAYLAGLERLARLAREREDATTVARLLRQATATDPLRESATRDLMEALAEAGDHAAVLQVYRDLRLLLHREVNAEPSPETQALFERLRQAARPAADPRRVSARERRDREAPRHNLPLLLTSFVGREREQDRVRDLIATARLVTLTGAGGCGKTRLALRVASDLVEEHRDGAWFADLSALSSPDLVLPAVAQVLGIRGMDGQSPEAGLAAFVARRELLLVLDNCEHLLDACAALCEQLLRRAPGLRILATSRAPLGVTGEVAWRLPSLPAPDPNSLPRDFALEKGLAVALGENAAVRLFCERARLVRPDFRLTTENARSVAEVCHALDGIPLAIELAAARLRGMPPSRLNDMLREALGARFRLLVSDERTRPARQQTLHAAMEWSFRLLSAPERRLLASLSIFSDGWTLEAAQSIAECGMRNAECGIAGPDIPHSAFRTPQSEVLDLLYQLVDRSLVLYEEREEAGRYRMLETVREFAAAAVSPEEEALLRRRHADYFLSVAEQARFGTDSPDQGAWVAALEADLGNLRLALRFWHGLGGGEALLRMVRGLYVFWKVRGAAHEGRVWMERAVAAAGDAPGDLVAMCARCAGLLAREETDSDGARVLFERAMGIAKASGNRAMAASVLNDLGTLSQQEGDYEEARGYFDQARAENAALGNRLCLSMNLGNLGMIARHLGDLTAAESYLDEGLAMVREESRSDVVPGFLAARAAVALGRNDRDQARRMAEEGLAMARGHGDRSWEMDCLEVLAEVASADVAWTDARELLLQFLMLAQRSEAHLPTVRALEGFAALLSAAGGADPRAAALSAQLAASADAARRRARSPLTPADRRKQDQALERARALLGDGPFQAAWDTGAASSPSEAVTALQTVGLDLPLAP